MLIYGCVAHALKAEKCHKAASPPASPAAANTWGAVWVSPLGTRGSPAPQGTSWGDVGVNHGAGAAPRDWYPGYPMGLRPPAPSPPPAPSLLAPVTWVTDDPRGDAVASRGSPIPIPVLPSLLHPVPPQHPTREPRSRPLHPTTPQLSSPTSSSSSGTHPRVPVPWAPPPQYLPP